MATSTFTLRARWVLPMDGPPLDGGYVSVHAGRIAGISARSEGASAIEDLGDAILLPGLVNAHTHLEFSDLRAPLGKFGVGLPDWIRAVIGERKRRDRDAAAAVAEGLEESLSYGVTTLGEIATASADCYQTVGPKPLAVLFQEAIGFSAARADSVLTEFERRFDDSPEPAGISPHAPYSCHPRLVERLVQLAISRQAAVAMHLAESREEVDFLVNGGGPFQALLEERSMWDPAAIPAGSRPLDYLQLLAEAPRSLIIHGNYLTTEEIEFIARRQSMSAVFCPRTHAYFEHSTYPLETMLAAGVRVALGTDSRASSPDLSVMAEAAETAQRFPAIGAERILQMATIDGAVALGLGGEVGSIAPGKRADLLAISCRAGEASPYEALLAESRKPAAVWLQGIRQEPR